ncbi:MAG: carboxypeptidase regulatory-like domain-containing protein [Planctomycetes bacterium]|nr:carboxypeptidase regulatory-like domain-containing protein [Planctomycetota bacterium]MCB9936021.1 carboxypeptidase regulatory-like domain-containing protein [Planctomycetota bacterium]
MKGSTLLAGLLALLIACGVSFGAGYYVAKDQGDTPTSRPVPIADTGLDEIPAPEVKPLDAPAKTAPETGQPSDLNAKPAGEAAPIPAAEAGETPAKYTPKVEVEQKSEPSQPKPATPKELEDQIKDLKDKIKELKPEDVEDFENIFNGPKVDFSATISGQVVDGAGVPVAGASLHANYSENYSSDGGGRRVAFVMSNSDGDSGAVIATTDGGGFFTATINRQISEKASLQVSLTAAADGYAESKKETFTLKNGDNKENIKLTLRGAGSVTGRVVDGSGVGVAGVKVSLNTAGGGNYFGDGVEIDFGGGGGKYNGTTDATGEFRIEGVAEGRYKFRLKGAGYRQVSGPTEIDVKSGESARAPADFQVAITASMAVKFTSTEGTPVQGWASVKIIGEGGKVAKHMNGPIGKDGLFEQNDPPAGSYEVEFQVWGYKKQTVRATFTEGQRYDFGVISLEPDAEGGSSSGGGIYLPGDDE